MNYFHAFDIMHVILVPTAYIFCLLVVGAIPRLKGLDLKQDGGILTGSGTAEMMMTMDFGAITAGGNLIMTVTRPDYQLRWKSTRMRNPRLLPETH